jgi:hypothetical protein
LGSGVIAPALPKVQDVNRNDHWRAGAMTGLRPMSKVMRTHFASATRLVDRSVGVDRGRGLHVVVFQEADQHFHVAGPELIFAKGGHLPREFLVEEAVLV